MATEAAPYFRPDPAPSFIPADDLPSDPVTPSLSDRADASGAMESDTLGLARLMVRARGCERRGDMAGAAAHYAEALARDPAHAVSMLRLSNLHLQCQAPEEALRWVDQALRLLPDDQALHYTRGRALHEALRLDEALAAFEHALAVSPEPTEAGFARSGTALMQGDLARGWAWYESRPRLGQILAPWVRLGLSPLPPGASLAGQGLLLLADQGYGDMLQFVRFVPQVLAACASSGEPAWLVCPPALCELFGRMATRIGLRGVTHVVPAHPKGLPPGLGWILPLTSSPLHLGLQRGWALVPGHPDHRPPQGYLQADPARVAQWQSRLGPRTRPRVALAWSGGEGRQADWGRSIPLAQLLPWLPAGIDYLHLQPEVRASDREALAGAPHIRHFGADIDDFDDSAALCMLADRVVSVCTSAAHLAGALGRPVTVLLKRTPCWRWGLEGEGSAWYPSARLLRQPDHRQWEPVLAALHQELVALRDGHSTEAMATTISPTAAQSCQWSTSPSA